MLEEPGVGEAVVALRPTGALAGYVVTSPDVTDPAAAADRALARCRARLPAYMVPAGVDVLDALPTMPSGKVDRRLLPAPVPRGPSRVPTARGPRDDLERAVREAWAQELEVPAEDLPVDADLFGDLGGHSLVAARIASRLRERAWGRTPGLRDV